MGVRISVISAGRRISESIVTGCNAGNDGDAIDVVNSDWTCFRTDDFEVTCTSSTRGKYLCNRQDFGTGTKSTIQPTAPNFDEDDQVMYLALWKGGNFASLVQASRMEIEWDMWITGSAAADTQNYFGVCLFCQQVPGSSGNFGLYGCGLNRGASGAAGAFDNMRIWEQPSAYTPGDPLTALATAALPTTVPSDPDVLKFVAARSGGTMSLQGFWNGALVVNTVASEVFTQGRVGLGMFKTAGVGGGPGPQGSESSSSILTRGGGGGVPPPIVVR